MTPLYLLVPGWGFDATFFDPLRRALAPAETLAWDLGFCGKPSRPIPPSDRPIIAVGHSFGLLWLLHERPIPWRALVAVNGFARFAVGPDFLQGVPLRVLQRMEKRLGQDPAAVHAEFLKRLGFAGPMPAGGLDLAVAAAGLDALARWDCRVGANDVGLVLAGRSDPICSSGMTLAGFASERIRWHEDGHLLPLTDAPWCAARLREFAELKCDGSD